MVRAACWSSVVLSVVLVAACSSDEEPGPEPTPGIAKPTGHLPITLDELESQMLAGVEDESVPMTEEQLDKYFPLVERLTTPPKQADRDPAKGDASDVKKTFDAFTPTENPDDHFTIDTIGEGVTPEEIARAKKGILFGLANWDAFKPGFSLTAASSIAKGGKPFKVSIKKTEDEKVKWRPYVLPCGGAAAATNTVPEVVAAIEADTCIPRLVLSIEPGKMLEQVLSPYIFVHEMAHVAHNYYQRSPAYLAAGGVKQAGAYNGSFNWQSEGDAQFTSRHAPNASTYEEVLFEGCPFEALRRGAFAWNDFEPTRGADPLFSYQMGIFVDQVTWHRFGKDPAWTYQWLIPKLDPRSVAAPPARPYDPARRLMQLVSKDTTKTDFKSINNVFLQAGVDLYFKGKNPWTARQLTSDCIQPGASVDLPLLAFDAIRVDPGDLSKVAKLRLSLEASRDRNFLKAGVAAVALDDAGKPKFVECLKQQITENVLSNADPRAGCLQSNVTGLSVLSEKNDYKDEVQLPATFGKGKIAIIAIVAHLMKRNDAPNTPIKVTLRAEPVSTPPGNQLAKSQCGGLTEEYRSRCKTKNCFCIGNAYCEANVDPVPGSCELLQRDCYLFCAFQKDECDCTSFCDLLYTRLACSR